MTIISAIISHVMLATVWKVTLGGSTDSKYLPE